jgi:hypothetical protein
VVLDGQFREGHFIRTVGSGSMQPSNPSTSIAKDIS